MATGTNVRKWAFSLMDTIGALYGELEAAKFIYKFLRNSALDRSKIIDVYDMGMQYDDMHQFANDLMEIPWIKNGAGMGMSCSPDEIDVQEYVEFNMTLRPIIAGIDDMVYKPWNYSKYGNNSNFNTFEECLPNNNVYSKSWIGGGYGAINEFYGKKYRSDVGTSAGIKFKKTKGLKYCLVAQTQGITIEGTECTKTDTGDPLKLITFIGSTLGNLMVCWMDEFNQIQTSKDLRRDSDVSTPKYPNGLTSTNGDRTLRIFDEVAELDGGSDNFNKYPINVYEIIEFDVYANCWVFQSFEDAKLYLTTGDTSKAINQPIIKGKNYIDLNIGNNYNSSGNPPRVRFEFVDPKPGLITDYPDQIRIEWRTELADKNASIRKELIYDIPANTYFAVQFDGANIFPIMNMENDSGKIQRTVYIYDGDSLIWAGQDTLTNLVYDAPWNNIFMMPTDSITPSGDNIVYYVTIKTRRIFLRYWPFAFSRDELPTPDDPKYGFYYKSDESIYVRPDGLPDIDGNVIRCYDHMMDFRDIKEMKDASDIEYP